MATRPFPARGDRAPAQLLALALTLALAASLAVASGALVVGRATMSVLVFVAVVAAAYYGAAGWRLRDARLRAAELEAKVAKAELRSLRAQLCPHFLFNALNSACGLITAEPERAELMIERLSQLLRIALQTEGIDEVPLAKELEFASAYLDIEAVRFQERLQVTVSVAPDARESLVPNFLLQPLVENAVHHAVAPSREPRHLELVVERRNGSLAIEVRDDGPGLADGALARRRGAIGLATTRARLEHLYGGRCSLSVHNRPTGGAVAEVLLPFRAVPAPLPSATP